MNANKIIAIFMIGFIIISCKTLYTYTFSDGLSFKIHALNSMCLLVILSTVCGILAIHKVIMDAYHKDFNRRLVHNSSHPLGELYHLREPVLISKNIQKELDKFNTLGIDVRKTYVLLEEKIVLTLHDAIIFNGFIPETLVYNSLEKNASSFVLGYHGKVLL